MATSRFNELENIGVRGHWVDGGFAYAGDEIVPGERDQLPDDAMDRCRDSAKLYTSAA